METSRERTLKAVNHIQPDTTPVHILGFADLERWLQYFHVKDAPALNEKLGLDAYAAVPIYTGPYAKRGLSIWGTKLNVLGYKGVGYSRLRGEYPLSGAESVADIERFAWPNPDEFDYEIMRKMLQRGADKACRIGPGFLILEESLRREDISTGIKGKGENVLVICTLFDLFGFEETLTKLYTEPKIIEAAISHLETFLLGHSRRMLEATKGLVDFYWISDDFASARNLMMSPEHWRKYLKPTYRRIFDLAKSYGVKIWFHCCGMFRSVLPDLIDIGMDLWETVQVHLPGNEPEVLKREYGQDITFFGAINTQQTLPFGTPDDVRSEVRERVRVLGKGGGYICGPDHSILPDVPIENVIAMLDEAKKVQP